MQESFPERLTCRNDNEDVIYTKKLDAIPVSESSTELRAEIVATPLVILGKINKFVRDEVDALVGVPSNVPPTNLVSCLFEILRSGGTRFGPFCLWKVLISFME